MKDTSEYNTWTTRKTALKDRCLKCLRVTRFTPPGGIVGGETVSSQCSMPNPLGTNIQRRQNISKIGYQMVMLVLVLATPFQESRLSLSIHSSSWERPSEPGPLNTEKVLEHRYFCCPHLLTHAHPPFLNCGGVLGTRLSGSGPFQNLWICPLVQG